MRMLVLVFTFFIINTIVAQSIYTDADVEVCNSKFEFAVLGNLIEKPINDIIVEIGKTSLGLDYEAHTLEKGDSEQLVIHLTGLDCYTFFESSLVFARCIKKNKTTFKDFQNELRLIRYRNGKINKYPSRLHYASDWLYDNAKRGIVKDVTKEIGGEKFTKKIDFMSNHPQSYKQLKANPEFVKQIADIEVEITDRDKYFIAQENITEAESKIKNGDIILITANTEGLDISHTGIAVKMENGRIHFMHAPLLGKKIQITSEPLSEYVIKLKRHTGIMVARALEPEC